MQFLEGNSKEPGVSPPFVQCRPHDY